MVHYFQMRKLTFIIITFFSLAGFSQNPGELVRWLKTYHLDSPVVFDTTGFNKLPTNAEVCDQNDEKDWSQYHVADLNNDGLNDLIFSGPCMPYHRTIIYLNSGDSTLLSYDFAGKVV